VNATEDKWSANYKMYDYVTKELPTLIESEFNVIPGKKSVMGQLLSHSCHHTCWNKLQLHLRDENTVNTCLYGLCGPPILLVFQVTLWVVMVPSSVH
jgi:S-formylglutathione hydrolase